MSGWDAMEAHYRRQISELYTRIWRQTSIVRVEAVHADGTIYALPVLRVIATPDGTIVQVSQP